MVEKPLLIFAKHTVADRNKEKTSFGSPNFNFPSRKTQKDRLTPQIESMIQSFISDNTAGIEPEYVLVIETIGKIEDFERAVRAIPGLEWLAEIEQDEIEPDENYFEIPKINKRLFSNMIKEITAKQSTEIWEKLYENKFIDQHGLYLNKPIADFINYIPQGVYDYHQQIIDVINNEITESQKNLISGRLFLTMSNREAIEHLYFLWRNWVSEKKLPFGYGHWADIFKHLKSIRKWDVEDRIRETGIIRFWKEELEIKRGTNSKILFEIEFWYRNDLSKREQIENDEPLPLN